MKSLEKIFLNKNGFTLVELVIVVAVVGVLSSIAVPLFWGSILKARQMEAAASIGQYMKAVDLHYLEFNTYPSSYSDLEKYVSVPSCPVPDPKRCRELVPRSPTNSTDWISQSGYYNIILRGGYGC